MKSMLKYSRHSYQLTSGSSHSFESRNTSESRSCTLHTHRDRHTPASPGHVHYTHRETDIHKSDSISTTLATSVITLRNTNVDHMYNALFQLLCIFYFYHKTGDY